MTASKLPMGWPNCRRSPRSRPRGREVAARRRAAAPRMSAPRDPPTRRGGRGPGRPMRGGSPVRDARPPRRAAGWGPGSPRGPGRRRPRRAGAPRVPTHRTKASAIVSALMPAATLGVRADPVRLALSGDGPAVLGDLEPADRPEQLAGGQPLEMFGSPRVGAGARRHEQRHQQAGRLGERLGQSGPARLLERTTSSTSPNPSPPGAAPAGRAPRAGRARSSAPGSARRRDGPAGRSRRTSAGVHSASSTWRTAPRRSG